MTIAVRGEAAAAGLETFRVTLSFSEFEDFTINREAKQIA